MQWCGSITKTFGHKASAPIKTFIDQAIHHPLVYFPAFFGIKAVVSGQPLSAAVHKYQTEIWDSLKALWMVWVPAQVRGVHSRAQLAGGGAARLQLDAGFGPGPCAAGLPAMGCWDACTLVASGDCRPQVC